MHDDKTINHNWPLPHKENILADDVERIRAAFIAIDAAFTDLESKLQTELIKTIEAKIAKIEEKISTVETNLEKQNVFSELGLYLDDDGDIAQDLTHNTGGNTGGNTGNNDDDNNNNNDNENSDNIATDEEVDAMLNEIFNNS